MKSTLINFQIDPLISKNFTKQNTYIKSLIILFSLFIIVSHGTPVERYVLSLSASSNYERAKILINKTLECNLISIFIFLICVA